MTRVGINQQSSTKARVVCKVLMFSSNKGDRNRDFNNDEAVNNANDNCTTLNIKQHQPCLPLLLSLMLFYSCSFTTIAVTVSIDNCKEWKQLAGRAKTMAFQWRLSNGQFAAFGRYVHVRVRWFIARKYALSKTYLDTWKPTHSLICLSSREILYIYVIHLYNLYTSYINIYLY